MEQIDEMGNSLVLESLALVFDKAPAGAGMVVLVLVLIVLSQPLFELDSKVVEYAAAECVVEFALLVRGVAGGR